VLTKRGLQWFFRSSPYDDINLVEIVNLLKYLNTTHPGSIKTIAILHEDTEFGTTGASIFEPLAKEAGFTVVEKISYRSGTPTLDAEVLRLKAANPDVLWVAAYLTDAILLQKTLAKYNVVPKVIYYYGVVENPQFAKETGSLGWYVLDKSGFNWDLFEQNPKLRDLNSRFKERYGIDLNDASMRNYVAVWILYYALEEAGKRASPENLQEFRKALRDALLEVDIGKGVFPPWDGVKFSTTGPDLHQNIRARSTIMQLMPDGKWYTVWPVEYATKSIVFPFPPWSERPSS
jgi:branched-chain amino acid transport system substrate-binding protein